VLEAGYPGDSTTWRDVRGQLGQTTRTGAYDRAGLGNSLPMPGVHDARDEIADLQRLLGAAGIRPPCAGRSLLRGDARAPVRQ
jgi:pimeloyl-ACP methyl ester carboxylesterase